MAAARRAVVVGASLLMLGAPLPASAAPAGVATKLRAARAPATELKQTAAIPLPGGAVVYRFRQGVGGVPVLKGQAVVSDGVSSPPRLIVDGTRRSVRAPPAPRVARSEAIAIASAATGGDPSRRREVARLAIRPGEGGTLVWRTVIPSGRPAAEYEVLVDATTGDVLRTRNLLRHSRGGRAQLYDPNPVAEHGPAGLRSDHRDNDTPLLNRLRRKARLRKIDDGQHCLRGRWAHAFLGDPRAEVCKPSLNWQRVKRAKDRFEALMVYFHINRAQRYIQRLGFGKAHGNPIDDRAQVGVADERFPFPFPQDNSFYDALTRKIKYGAGGVDDAEDADVILHEYGHAMQDRQSRAFGLSSGLNAVSLAEGSSDYWAAVMSSRSPHTDNVDDVCIFDWDGVSWGAFVPQFNRRCGRRADSSMTLAQASSHQGPCFFPGQGLDPHCVGVVWSSALWDLRSDPATDDATFDRLYLDAQFEYVDGESFQDAVESLLDVDANDNAQLYHGEICNEMESERGIDVPDCP